tara:strand:+ start:198 stop:413 length:216 start_codon:yes stop_codon:yes gene_type:complete
MKKIVLILVLLLIFPLVYSVELAEEDSAYVESREINLVGILVIVAVVAVVAIILVVVIGGRRRPKVKFNRP